MIVTYHNIYLPVGCCWNCYFIVEWDYDQNYYKAEG